MVEMFGGAWRRWDGLYVTATPDEGLRDWLVGLLGEGRGYPVKNGGVSK